LNSPTAVQASIFVVRAFVRLRQLVASQEGFALRLAKMEEQVVKHDRHLKVAFDLIKKLMEPPSEDEKKTQIGFHSRE
jgi:hypothetical protein